MALQKEKGSSTASPAREVVLQNPHVSLWYYPDLKLVHHQMLQAPPSEAFRDLLTHGADLVERFHASKWLSDDRANTLLRPDDEEWANKNWLPRVLRGGFKFWAIVLPQAAIGKLNMKRLASEHKADGITSFVDTDPARAFDWLVQQ